MGQEMKCKSGKGKSLRKRMDGAEAITVEVRGIKSIDMTFKAKNVVEQLFWASFGMIGVIWAVFFILNVLQDKNPIIIRSQDFQLSDLNYPAITACTDLNTKYSMVERLGNYFDSTKKLPSKLESLRNIMFEKAFFYNRKDWALENYPKGYNQLCIPTTNKNPFYTQQKEILPLICPVSRDE